MSARPRPGAAGASARCAAVALAHGRLPVPDLLAVHDLVQDAGGDLRLPRRSGSRPQIQFANYAVLFKDGDAATVWNSLVIAGASTVPPCSSARSAPTDRPLPHRRRQLRHLDHLSSAWCRRSPSSSRSSCSTCGSAGSTRFIGLILLYTAFNLPYVIWMMRGYIRTSRSSSRRAALVDGCTRWQVFWKVVLPMARAGLFATAVFTFVFAWNEFLFALVLTRTDVTTFPVQVTPLFRRPVELLGQDRRHERCSARSRSSSPSRPAALPGARHLAGRGEGLDGWRA